MLNLCRNSLDAMRGAGDLAVTLEETFIVQPCVVSHGRIGRGPHARLTVADTGSGMSPEATARSFESFFSTRPNAQGAGRGMTTVHALVAELGGAIDVASAEGVGTILTVWLPVAG